MKKLHLHLESFRKSPALYHLTEERWQAAAKRHRALAKRLNVTIGWDGDILDEALKTADLMINSSPPRERLRERAPRLKWIQTTSAGIDDLLPLDWLPHDVFFTNNRGAHGAKAEQFVRMALALLHSRIPEILANQRARRWRQVFSSSIAGKTALIIGLGDLGQAAARAAKDLGLKVIGISRSGKKVRHADAVHTASRLEVLLPQADYVVMAVPLTADTQRLLNRARLDLMKPTAGVINIARAEVADHEALAEKLRRAELAGAVLDVMDPEPLPPESPLWETPNLIITPHIACDDADHYVDITLDLWFENLERFLQGRPLKNRVDSRRGY